MWKINPLKSKLVKLRNLYLGGMPDKLNSIETELRATQNSLREQVNINGIKLGEISNRLINAGYLKLSDSEVMAKIFSGAKMYLDPHDIALVPHLILDGDWERNITKAWMSIVREKDVIIDIGANFGYFAVLAAQVANRACKVVAFEANPHLIPYLKKTINVNSFEECTVIENLAISDKPGNVSLNILKDYIASSSIHDIKEINSYNTSKLKLEASESVKVNATSLDVYCKNNKISQLNLIKMDIEGYEDVAYAGMRDIIKSSPDVTLFVEFTKKGYAQPKKFYNQMLKDFGNVYLIDEAGVLYRPSSDTYEDIIETSDGWVMPVFSKDNNLIARQK